MRPKKLDLTNCLLILRSCHEHPRTAQELQRSTGLSRSTFFRTLIALREQLLARIDFEGGRYTVVDWGLLNRRRACSLRGLAGGRARADAQCAHDPEP